MSSLCAAGGVLLAFLLRVAVGNWPNATVVAGLGLVSFGAVLVVSRFSRLGPFRGELGSPWAESELREHVVSEANRAARYARPMSVVAVRARRDRRLGDGDAQRRSRGQLPRWLDGPDSP